MNNKEDFIHTMQKVREIYIFLTEKEPTPDDEIEAREELIDHFQNLMSLNKESNKLEIISEINSDLKEWDTLELWFSETSIPLKMKKFLNLPDHSETLSIESSESKPEVKKEDSVLDLTDIFNKVSEQFQGEIDSLKVKIDNLKKQLEEKDEKLKTITEKRKVQKITPKRQVKLPPPKIKIPIIKKIIQGTPQPSKKVESLEKIPKETTISQKIDSSSKKVDKQELSPIPFKEEVKFIEQQEENLTSIPKSKPIIEPIVIEESKDVPIITEKRKITPVVTKVKLNEAEEAKDKPSPFLVEKPKISSVSIQEIERESIKSTSSDLFNVFSSIGTKMSETSEEKTHELQEKPKKNVELPSSKQINNSNKNYNNNSFVNFNTELLKNQTKTPSVSQEDMGTDKDSLYQELIALEGKRYAIEKSYKDLDRNYGKGSIADTAYKEQSEKLKNQLDEITTRINNIRRLISSL